MALQKPRVDPAADAEVLLWQISVADQATNNQDVATIYKYQIRLKVFTDRGAKKFQVPDIEYAHGQHIYDVAGRTIQPNGSEQEAMKDGILDHVLQKSKGVNERAVSIAMPNVHPGTIVEYRWRETHDNELADNVSLPACREIPVERIVYHVKPLVNQYFPYSMRYAYFNIDMPPFQKDRDGFYVTELHNVPAYQDEDFAPPAADVRPWLLIYYLEDKKQTSDQFWKEQGKAVYASYKDQIKVNGDIRAVADSVTAETKDPEEQVRRLYEYCQKNIKNLSGRDVSDADRQKLKGNHNSVDTLKHAAGTAMDIQMLFAALVADRQLKFFNKEMMNRYFTPSLDIGVQVNGHWKLYDIGTDYLQPGSIRWQEEGVFALITDDKKPEWIQTPFTDAPQSRVVRTGTLQLDNEGNLEGNLTESLTGHKAEEWWKKSRDRSPAEREEAFKNALHEQFANAELSNIRLPDPLSRTLPVTFSYHVKIENYATRTGKRLIFAPAVLEVNEAPLFQSSQRRSDIYLPYGWSEVDDLRINTPKGFDLDHPDLPRGVTVPPFMTYSVKIRVGKNFILYHRDLTVGDKGVLMEPAKRYPAVKQIFDTMHDSDGHLLTLKLATAQPVAQTLPTK